MISVVSPVYNEEKTIEELYLRVEKTLNNINQKFEMIFVDNGSQDKSLEIIKRISQNNKNVKYISLTKNFGHQGGIWAGIDCSIHSIIIIDADLQQPPEKIEEFIHKWKDGFKIVKTKKVDDKDRRWWKKFFSAIFYKLINKITRLNLFEGQSDFCLIDRDVVVEIKKFKEKKTFLRGIINFTGFKSCFIDYTVDKRKNGESKFSTQEYFSFAVDGIFNYSKVPIGILFWLGTVISIVSFSYIIYLLILYFVDSELMPPGWVTNSTLIMFFGSINLVALSILGKYILLLQEDSKNRPEYFIKEKNF